MGVVTSGIINSNGSVAITNDGANGIDFAKGSVTTSTEKLIVTNTQGGVTVADGAELLNNSTTKEDNLTISNSGSGKVSILGKLTNKKGNISINNDGAESGVEVGTTGTLTTEDGNTTIANLGKSGIDIEGKILTQQGNIEIFNKNSNIEIGEYNSSNDSYIEANNVMISQNDGSIINGVNDEGNVGNNQSHDLGNKDKAYKTLIKANNLVMVVQNGDIGSDTHALSDKESGFGVDASTRDYTESINVEVSDTISAIANNDNNALINIRAKNSNLNIDNIVSDGNVMLTVADWKQPDQNPTPSNEDYYHGYSINNASKDGITPNVVGRNISIISSDNIGSESNKLTYEQLENGSVSILAENDIYVSDKSANSNINALITKRGTLDIELDGDAVINEITSGKKLKITSLAKNLTIYSLGKISPKDGVESDILFPHDGISGSSGLGVVPEQIEIKVLDVNQDNSNDADSTLNIYSAYLKGADNGSPDVLLRADNIIAHAYQAPSSKVITKANPSGFDAQAGRTYINNQGEVIEAAGFNTVGAGKSLTFDIQGVSKDDVIAVNKDVLSRKYNTQQSIKTTPDFENKNAVLGTLYMVDDLSLSLNSSSDSSDENRGMQINKLYVNNAYVDTKDLTLSMDDGFVNNYAEFVNGNRGGTSGAHSISDSYRWKTVVDNDYYRNVAQQFDTPVTTQLYTALTGSFNLSMGDSIKQASKAPAVVYDVYEVFNRPYSENSFYRHTYKENKIQLQSVNALFDRRDNYSHMPNKREFIRFGANLSNDTIVDVAYKTTSGKNRILAIHDISKGGLLVTHDGSLKLKEQFNINLAHNDVDVNVDVKVVRIEGNKAGLQFVNLDQAKANKILYLNLSVDVSNEVIIKESKR